MPSDRPRDYCTWLTRFIILSFAITAVTACAPSPEERVARAENYMAEADYRAAILELKNALQANQDLGVARLMLAEASYQVGDLPTAESEFERALGLGEDRPAVWLALGRTLLELGRVEDAFERVMPNLDDKMVNEDAYVFKGDVLTLLDNITDAEIAYAAALGINPESPGAMVGNATLAAAAGNHDQARELFERTTDTNPDSAMAWSATGNYLSNRRAYVDAADAYSQSIAVESATTPLLHRFQTRVNRASVLIESRSVDDAEQQLSELTLGYPPHPILRYLAGRIAFVRGDYEDAQQALQDYLARVPRDARGQALLGAVHFSRNNLRQAEMYLMQAVRANPGGETTRRLLAETLLRLNNPQEALTELKLSESLGMQDPMLLGMLGRAEIGVGDTDEAIRYFEQSVAADPDNPSFSLALAAAYLQGDRAKGAIRVLEAMADVPGSLYRRETLLIGAYLQDGQNDAAIARGNELLLANPDDPQAFALVGVLSNTTGDAERAQQMFERALELDSENLGALYNLGTIAFSREDYVTSEDFFGQLLDAHPANVAGLVSIAAALQQQGRLGELRTRLNTAIEAAPDSVEPRVLMARMELVEGRTNEALEQVAEAQALFPDEPGLNHLKGRILQQRDRPRAAVQSLLSAVAAAPKNATYVFDLASAQLTNADYLGAAASARKYRRLQPNDIRGLALLADAEIRSGRPQAVADEVEKFLGDNPDVAAAHLVAGDVQLALDSPQEALPHYEKAASIEWSRGAALQIARARNAAGVANATEPLQRWLAGEPDDSTARLMYAQLLDADGDTKGAVAEYEILQEAGELNAVSMNNLAWHYFLNGRGDAVDLAQQAYDLDPENGSITDTLGWILFKGGETDRSLGLLKQAVERSPDNPEIRFHLAMALATTGESSEAKTIIDELIASGASFSSREEAQQLAKTL